MDATPDTPELQLSPIDIRRAVLATFFRAGGGPLTIGEVVRRTLEAARRNRYPRWVRLGRALP